ncbi:MAG: metallophosphoesterase [Candidatus Hodarchaeota archaeon]
MNKVSLLAFSDIHGNVKAVKEMLQDISDKTFDGILFAGDFSNAFVNGDIEEANDCYYKVMALLQSLDIPIYYVTGNRDFSIIFEEDNVILAPPKSELIRTDLPHNLEDKKKD